MLSVVAREPLLTLHAMWGVVAAAVFLHTLSFLSALGLVCAAHSIGKEPGLLNWRNFQVLICHREFHMPKNDEAVYHSNAN